jgi:hypothetical protein
VQSAIDLAATAVVVGSRVRAGALGLPASG